MKKTLLITSNFFPEEGGIGAYMGIYFYFDHRSLVVLAPCSGNFKKFDRVSKLKTVRSWWLGNTSKLARIFKPITVTAEVLALLKKNKFQAVHIADIESIPILLWIIFKMLGISVLIFVHGRELSVSGKIKINLALKTASIIIANSHYTRNLLVKEFTVPIDKIEVVNPGINLDFVKTKVDPSDAIKKYNPRGQFVILTVSRLVKRKGHFTVLKALSQLKRSGFKDFVYLIVGRGYEESRIKEEVKKLELEKETVFVGYASNEELLDLYSACDVFVMVPDNIAGDYEGFGIVYIEAGAFQKPVIGTWSGGVADAVEDGRTGFLINPGDHAALSRFLLRLARDKEVGAKLGKNGYKKAKQFTLDKVAGRFLSILEKNAL